MATEMGFVVSADGRGVHSSVVAKMLYSIRWEGEPPTLEEVRARFGFEGDEADEEFGVVSTAPDENLYAILVEESAVQRLRGEREAEAAEIEGPFSNPRIEPFGLQEPND
jgi:hypothetical protein